MVGALMKVQVVVMPKQSVLDPQGVAVRNALKDLGLDTVDPCASASFWNWNSRRLPMRRSWKRCAGISLESGDRRLHYPSPLNGRDKRMKIAVVQFPGSNCDQDCLRAFTDGLHVQAEYVWHKQTSVSGFDAVVLPGGFSYGDYLRCGAIARFSPIMRAVVRAAERRNAGDRNLQRVPDLVRGWIVAGALIRNQSLRFVCKPVWLRVETERDPFHGEVEGTKF